MKKIITALVIVVLAVIFTVSVSAETYIRGDFNMDGRINASDARLVLRVAASLDSATENQKLIADMNDDGKITASDARTILRVSAQLEDSKGEISIGETEEKTELLSGISMSIDDFMKKFGGMRELDTSDGTISYANDYVTVVSDPKMIISGNINSISITGGDYMLCGVYAGMSVDEALATLKDARWIVQQETASQVVLSKVGMNIKIAKSGDTVTFVEYYLGVSVVRPDDQDTSTTQPPENTTKPPETTTQPPETTTKPPETTTQAPITNEAFNNLPEQAKAFLNGNFSLKGYTYNKAQREAVAMYITKDNIKAGMSMDMGDGTFMDMDVLIHNPNGNSKIYIIANETKKYCELGSFLLGLVGLKPEDVALNYKAVDPNKVVISEEKKQEGPTLYTVYNIKSETESCDIYMVGDEIKRIYSYDNLGIPINQMEINEFSAHVPESEFSLDRYEKASFVELFGLDFDISDIIGGIL